MPFSTPSSDERDGMATSRASVTRGPWTYRSRSVGETRRLAEAIGRRLAGGEVFALYGEMGSGKTAFVAGLAAGLEVPARHVSSPTFVLVHEYRGRRLLVHGDLYRVDQSDIGNLGLDDYFDDQTVVAIEWADRAGNLLPTDRVDVRFAHDGKRRRVMAF